LYVHTTQEKEQLKPKVVKERETETGKYRHCLLIKDEFPSKALGEMFPL